ncbi:MAG: DsbC family protein [Marinicellaceae bacterium]
MYKKTSSLLIATAVIASFSVQAKEPTEAIVAGVKNLAPAAVVSSMDSTPIDGVSEIVIETGRGGEVYYISSDGKYLLNGNMIDTTSREDLTENKKTGIRKDLLSKFSEKQRVNFYPDEIKHHITVFTDIDCGYCRKLHNEMAEYNELGIGISYLFFPRSGVNTPSFDKAVSVWCAENQQEALTNAKAGVQMEVLKCDNPIEEHFNVGQSAGVNGTPAIVLDSGKMLPGYLPPQQLLERLKMMEAE